MLFAHLERALKLNRLLLRGSDCAVDKLRLYYCRPEPLNWSALRPLPLALPCPSCGPTNGWFRRI